MYALIDCNNFYASCERLFRPDLQNKPILVLSNNDGCIIARSNEAKALGIKMGEPYFKVRSLCKKHQVQVFSSNFALYGDLSSRVMSIIMDTWEHVEIYSIDEAFLHLENLPIDQHESFCTDLQKRLLKETGIPVSIGIGKTKTLAKAANYIAKRMLKIPVFNLHHQEIFLQNMPVGEVWGIGRQWQKKITALGIQTAADLANCDPHQMKKNFNITVMRTVLELQGIPCFMLELPEKSKSILSSRSFGTPQTEYADLAQAVSRYCSIACEKLRKQGSTAAYLTVFIRSSPYRTDLPQYSNSITQTFIHPTDNICELTKIAKNCLKRIYKKGIAYQKAGIMLGDLRDKHHQQADLFEILDPKTQEKTEKMLSVYDAINQKFGRHTLHLAAEGIHANWSGKKALRSPGYTTAWDELLLVK